jgi:hypothetical protein
VFEGVDFLQFIRMSVDVPGVSNGTCSYGTVVIPLNLFFDRVGSWG